LRHHARAELALQRLHQRIVLDRLLGRGLRRVARLRRARCISSCMRCACCINCPI
jgi:hypothetical protein